MKVTRPPLLKVDVNVEVRSEGANEVVCPRLLVVWMKTVLDNVVLFSCHNLKNLKSDKVEKIGHTEGYQKECWKW